MSETYTFSIYPSAWRDDVQLGVTPMNQQRVAVAVISAAGNIFGTGVYSITMKTGAGPYTNWTSAGFATADTAAALAPGARYLDVPQGGTGTARNDGNPTDVFFIHAPSVPYDILHITVTTNTPRPPGVPPGAGGTSTQIIRHDDSVVFDNPLTESHDPRVTAGVATPTQAAWQIPTPYDARGQTFVVQDLATRGIPGKYTPEVAVAFPPGVCVLHSSKGTFTTELVWLQGGAEIGKVTGAPLTINNVGWTPRPNVAVMTGATAFTDSGMKVQGISPPPLSLATFGETIPFGAPTFQLAGKVFGFVNNLDVSTAPAGGKMRVFLPRVQGATISSGGTLLSPISNSQWRWRLYVYAGNPAAGGAQVADMTQLWQAGGVDEWAVPEFTIPAGGNCWIRISLEVEVLSSVVAAQVQINLNSLSSVSVGFQTIPAGASTTGSSCTSSQLIVSGVAPKNADTYGVRLRYTIDPADTQSPYSQLTFTYNRPKVTVTWDNPNPIVTATPNKNYTGVMTILGQRFVDGAVVTAVDRLRNEEDAKPTPVFRGSQVIRGELFYYMDTTVPFNDDFLYRVTVQSSDGSQKSYYFSDITRYPSDLSYPHDNMCVPVHLSDPFVPGLSLWTGLMSIDPLSHPGRRELNDIIGRHTPVSLSDVRSTPRTVMHVLTRTLPEREHLLTTLASGRILFMRNPDPRYPENNWFISVGEVTENRIIPNHADPRRVFDIEIALVSRPSGLLSAAYGRSYEMLRDYEKDGATPISPKTYAHVASTDNYGTYLAVLLAEPSSFININTRPEYVYGAGLYPTRVAAETSWSLV